MLYSDIIKHSVSQSSQIKHDSDVQLLFIYLQDLYADFLPVSKLSTLGGMQHHSKGVHSVSPAGS